MNCYLYLMIKGIYTDLTKKALKLCFEAHKDQVDKIIKLISNINITTYI